MPVYLISNGDSLKIGRTDNLEQRMSAHLSVRPVNCIVMFLIAIYCLYSCKCLLLYIHRQAKTTIYGDIA